MPETATADAVIVRRVIDAPAEKIFRAWTDPAHIKNWFTPNEAVTMLSADVDAREGGSYRLTFVGPQRVPFSVTGVYRTVRPCSSLEFTWIWDDPDLAVGETLVAVQLNPQGGSTELTLTHTLLPTPEAREGHTQGWTAILESLAANVAG
ncbi:MAG TPA: SRPBCC domain-containing protein [Chthonomonadaceae bacterium]|nr:SRPBCC domain-containing protein [Chthonomonadaceae bacterium]